VLENFPKYFFYVTLVYLTFKESPMNRMHYVNDAIFDGEKFGAVLFSDAGEVECCGDDFEEVSDLVKLIDYEESDELKELGDKMRKCMLENCSGMWMHPRGKKIRLVVFEMYWVLEIEGLGLTIIRK